MKVRDRNSASGSIGFAGATLDDHEQHERERADRQRAERRADDRAPSGGHSSRPKTMPPSPSDREAGTAPVDRGRSATDRGFRP